MKSRRFTIRVVFPAPRDRWQGGWFGATFMQRNGHADGAFVLSEKQQLTVGEPPSRSSLVRKRAIAPAKGR
jgi:hypothetical protein